MATKKKQRAELNQEILTALEFIAPLVEKGGYFLISNGWFVALNNNYEVAATKTSLTFTAAPNFVNFKAAIEQCQDEVAITLDDDSSLSIISGDFEIEINCTEVDRFKFPDLLPASYDFENSTVFKQSLNKALVAIKFKTKHQPTLSNCVMVDSKGVIATNSHVLIYAQTQENFPGKFYITKAQADILAKSEKRLTGLGSDGIKGTFYFEDESFYHFEFAEWITANLYKPLEESNMPPLDSDLWAELPPGFWQTLKSIKKFSDKDKVVFEENKVYTEDTKAKASFVLDSSFEKIGFQIKYILSIEKLIKKAVFSNSRILMFTDGHCFGIVMGLDFGKHHEAAPTKPEPFNEDEFSDDIPF